MTTDEGPTMATILLPALLRRYTGGAAEVQVEASTVGQALDALFAAHPDLCPRVIDTRGRIPRHLLVFVGDRALVREGYAAVPVSPGDTIRILVAVGGGSADVRMRGFRHRASVEEALTAALDGVATCPRWRWGS